MDSYQLIHRLPVLNGMLQQDLHRAAIECIATVLDEAMGKVCRFSDARAVTAELTVEYLRPVRVDEEIQVQAFERERHDRQFYHEGEIRNTAGQLLARGRGRFVAVNPVRHGP